MSAAEVERLRRGRARSRWVRGLAVGAAGLTAYAWLGGAIDFDALFTGRRLENLRTFATRDAVPPEVARGEESVGGWAWGRVVDRNGAALLATAALATVAALLAAAGGALLCAWTARTALAARTPFTAGHVKEGGVRPWLGRGARGLCVVMRALPEYVLAFLFGAFFPDPAWACVLALAVHNAGILGRLYGETLENLDQGPARAWSLMGSTRGQALLGAQAPATLPRGLTYLFLRFETCVRESTILGAVGFVSLGYWLVQERAAERHDEMLLLAALGAVIVLAADLISWAARRFLAG